MLRHDHVTDSYKLMALADLLRLFEDMTSRKRARERGVPRSGRR
jgi:hypothetical protein